MIRVTDQATGRERQFGSYATLDEVFAWTATPATREEQLEARVRELEGDLKVRKRFDLIYMLGWVLLALAWWAK